MVPLCSTGDYVVYDNVGPAKNEKKTGIFFTLHSVEDSNCKDREWESNQPEPLAMKTQKNESDINKLT